MKQIYRLSLMLLALLLPALATAHDFEVDGIYYNINGTTATVTYRGSSYSQYSNEYSGDVTIPATVTYNGTTYSVISIGNSAFCDCSGLTSIDIPSSVTSIGLYAFRDCSSLTSITIPNSVTSIGNYAFWDCSGLTSVNISNSVTSIGICMFCGCTGLTSVTIPNSVISIGNSAFKNCRGLTSINIPNSVTSIGDEAFSFCSGLTSVTIPNSVTSISTETFRGCSGLTSVTIPNSVTSIYYGAFDLCSGLTSVHITDLAAWCKIWCSNNNANPLSYAHHLFLNGVEVKDLVIPNSVTSIGGGAFFGCSGLTSVIIPNSVTSIGDRAFCSCSGLTSVTIPNSVTSIGEDAFSYCSGLTSIDIPNSVTSIGDGAFFDCSGLTSVIIPNSVTSIGDGAFCSCRKLKTVIWNAENCTSIGSNAFTYSLSRLLFGEGVEHIPNGMPSLSMIGQRLVLPNSVKSIDVGAINGTCSEVVIGDSIENIAAGTFPTGISFAYVTATDPRPCEVGAFANPQTLYVPVGSKMKYFTSQGWSEFANIIEGTYVHAASITLNKSTAVMPKGSTQQLAATISPSNASTTFVTLWLSMNPTVATVSNDGQITAVSVGETDIIAMIDNVCATCHVTVTPVMVESLILSDTLLTLAKDDIYILTATVLPSFAENQTLEWIIPDNDVIVTQVVDNTRLNIGAVRLGSVTITVRTTDGSNLSATCTVNVQVLATSIALNMTSAEMTEDGVLQLFATVLPTNATNKAVTWISSNTSVATVDSDGLVTAQSPGTANITATTTDGTNLSATCSLSVKQNIIYVTSISLDKTSSDLTEGETLQLAAIMRPENATNKAVSWMSSNPNVATVDNNGLVTALSVGSATITATTTDGSNLSASCVVTVTEGLSDFENYLSIDDVEAFHGDTIVIPVKMINQASIISFQTDIFLPEGLEIVKEDGEYVIDPSPRMTRTHNIMSDDVSNGSIRVLCYSSNYKPFTGNSGDDMFYITVKVADDAEGDYIIQLKNTLLTNTDFIDIAAPDVVANVNVKSYLLGDANNSGTVTVTDVVVTAQYVLERNPQPFVFEAADVNFDNNITVADVSRIAWMVLNPSLNVPLRAPALLNNGDSMNGSDITLAASETRRVSIMLENEMDYSAFQLDLQLPDGLKASNFQLTDRAGSHAFDVNTLQNDNIRALCYSPDMTAINGHEGALLTFDVTATSNVKGDIIVDGIELITTACQSVRLDAFTMSVNNPSGFNEVVAGKTVAKVEYFNLAGQQIEQPESGITFVVATYTDGTRSTSKIIR